MEGSLTLGPMYSYAPPVPPLGHLVDGSKGSQPCLSLKGSVCRGGGFTELAFFLCIWNPVDLHFLIFPHRLDFGLATFGELGLGLGLGFMPLCGVMYLLHFIYEGLKFFSFSIGTFFVKYIPPLLPVFPPVNIPRVLQPNHQS